MKINTDNPLARTKTANRRNMIFTAFFDIDDFFFFIEGNYSEIYPNRLS